MKSSLLWLYMNKYVNKYSRGQFSSSDLGCYMYFFSGSEGLFSITVDLQKTGLFFLLSHWPPYSHFNSSIWERLAELVVWALGQKGQLASRKKYLQCSQGILEVIVTMNGYLRQCRCRLALMNITPFSCLENSGRCLLSTLDNLYTFPFSIILKAAPIGNCVLKGIHRPVLVKWLYYQLVYL